MPFRLAHVAAFCAASVAALSGCNTSAGGGDSNQLRVIDTEWTDAAAQRTQRLLIAGKAKYALPELRIYDAGKRLIYRQTGVTPSKVAEKLNAAIAQDRRIDGPTFAATLDDLHTRNGKPAAATVQADGRITIVDYWADWCVPCKMLEKELLTWARAQPPGAVQIVKAEADLVKSMRARGDKVIMYTKGPDGKLVKKEELN